MVNGGPPSLTGPASGAVMCDARVGRGGCTGSEGILLANLGVLGGSRCCCGLSSVFMISPAPRLTLSLSLALCARPFTHGGEGFTTPVPCGLSVAALVGGRCRERFALRQADRLESFKGSHHFLAQHVLQCWLASWL